MAIRKERSNFRFSDKSTVFQHDFLIYVFGADVTRHVRGAISLRRQNRESNGTLSFDLDNVNDIFTITADNIGYEKDNDGNYVKMSDGSSRATDVSDSVSDTVKKKVDELEKQMAALDEKIRAQMKVSSGKAEDIKNLTRNVDELSGKIASATTKKQKQSLTAAKKKEQNSLKAAEKAKASADKQIEKLRNEKEVLEKKRSQMLGNIKKTSDGKYILEGNFGSSSVANKNENDNRSGKAKGKHKNLSSEQVIKTLTMEDLYTDGLYSDSAKKLVYTNKSLLNVALKSGDFLKSVKFDSSFKPYSLEVDSCIFEKNDPVRFFIKDPSSLADEDKWAPMFTGFIQNITDHTDYLTGEKYFTISCYDIKAIMMSMRMMTNPRICRGTDTAYDSKNLASGDKSKIGFFGDFIAHSGNGGEAGTKYTHSRADEIVLDMITGRVNSDSKFGSRVIGSIVSTQSEDIVTGSSYDLDTVNKGTKLNKTTPSFNSVGCFMPGLVMECPDSKASLKNGKYSLSEEHVADMELWYDLLVFGTKCDYWTLEEVQMVGEATVPYGEYDPWCCWLHFLTPVKGTGAAELFSSQLDDLSSSYEFEPRAQVMNKLCATIDYQWYCTGSGDIVVEFPMYDFVPESFGEYSDQLRVNRHLVSCEINEITKDITTAVSVTGGVERPRTRVQGAIAFAYTGFAKSDSLAFKYGFRCEEMTIPSMRMDSSRNNLGKQAAVELVKANVLASSMSMDFVYRWALYPNKPIMNVDRNRLAVIDAFTYTITVNENVSCGVDCSYVRKKRPDGSFIHIFNGTSMPVVYTKAGTTDSSGMDDTDSGIDVFVIKQGG